MKTFLAILLDIAIRLAIQAFAVALGFLQCFAALLCWEKAQSTEMKALVLSMFLVTGYPLIRQWSKYWINFNRRNLWTRLSKRQTAIKRSTTENPSVDWYSRQTSPTLSNNEMMNMEAQNGYITHKDLMTMYLPNLIGIAGLLIGAWALKK
jgi:hypothetical protein